MQVFKWGNHLAVQLPANLVKALGLRKGDKIEVYATAKRQPDVKKPADVRDLLARIRKYRGRLPAGFQFSRELT